MAAKLFILAALFAVATCQYVAPVPAYKPAYAAPAYKVPEPVYPDAHPAYKFAYNVHDPSTYDVKSQEETRDGDYVSGVYTVAEADGTKRVVTYADNGHGFEAVVSKEGAAPAPYAPKYAAPAYPAPVAPAYPAPYHG
ncbi:unnamed protein product [Bemisia tabaci]|uniref:Cuticular protein n=1 Tax=Bemisia tabaci TaxID=7038 RepID=A0A9P0G1F7_BEMTA|nr:unnamed protein product [Bemisia tabaci]